MTVSSPLPGTPLAASFPRETGHSLNALSRNRKRVVLTGASGGIGILIAKRLLALDYQVIALCRSAPPIEHDGFMHLPCDLGSPDALDKASALIGESREPVFAVIHCAGTIAPSPVAQTDERAIADQIALNLSAPVLLTRLMLPLMQTVDGPEKSRIVFVNSMAAVMPLADSAVYAAAKAGLRSFALSLAQEIRPRGILVSSVFPGAVQTDMLIREMQQGGSMLNYVSTPLDPDLVAKAVTDQLTRHRRSGFCPPSMHFRAVLHAGTLPATALPAVAQPSWAARLSQGHGALRQHRAS